MEWNFSSRPVKNCCVVIKTIVQRGRGLSWAETDRAVTAEGRSYTVRF